MSELDPIRKLIKAKKEADEFVQNQFQRVQQCRLDTKLARTWDRIVKPYFVQRPIIQSFPELGVDGTTVKNPNDLKKYGTVSAFGLGDETVVDLGVRQSLEISADRVKGSSYSWHRFQQGAKACVKMLLGGRSFELKLHKILYYEKGGHFDEHVDAQHVENHLATCLVFVRSKYEGGELVVKHNGKEVVADLEDTKKEGGCSVAVAFFNSSRHQVKPVTEGTRAVFQFDVVVTAENPKPETIVKGASESVSETNSDTSNFPSVDEDDESLSFQEDAGYEYYDSNEKAIQKLVELINEEKNAIAFPLKHLYAVKDLNPGLLKGEDLYAYQRLKDKFKLSFAPTIFDYRMYYDGDGAFYYCHLSLPEGVDGHDVEMHWTRRVAFERYEYQSYIEYTGNESQPEESRYIGACMLIQQLKKDKV